MGGLGDWEGLKQLMTLWMGLGLAPPISKTTFTLDESKRPIMSWSVNSKPLRIFFQSVGRTQKTQAVEAG